MALPPEEEKWLSRALLDAARSGDLGRMKEFAGRLDRGQGLLVIYSKCRGHGGETAFDYARSEGRTDICKYLTEEVGFDVDKASRALEISGGGTAINYGRNDSQGSSSGSDSLDQHLRDYLSSDSSGDRGGVSKVCSRGVKKDVVIVDQLHKEVETFLNRFVDHGGALDKYKADVLKTKKNLNARKEELKEWVEESRARLPLMAEKVEDKKKQMQFLSDIISRCETYKHKAE